MTRPVVIIGAGVAGLGAAWELARRGVEVTVLERDQPGRGASGAAAGMLAPVAEARFGEPGLVDLAVESFGMWPAFRRSLEAASGTDLDYRDEGTLVVAVDQDDLAALEHVHRYHAERGLDAVIIDGAEARALEPGLAPSIPGAVHCRSDHQVDPRRMLDALSKAFTAAGGKLLTGVEVTAVVSDDGVASGLTTDGDWKAPPEACFVLAAGAWSRKIAGLDTDRPAVRPVRGQMIAVELGGPPICRHVIRAPDAYMVPKSDGRLLIGSTMEEMGFDERLTAGGLMDILTGAWEALPGIHELRVIDTWTGLRPVSLDNEPILRKSKLDRLWYATGHGRNGILLTPLSAQRVADMLMEEI